MKKGMIIPLFLCLLGVIITTYAATQEDPFTMYDHKYIAGADVPLLFKVADSVTVQLNDNPSIVCTDKKECI